MGLFRFPHTWVALTSRRVANSRNSEPIDSLQEAVPLLDDRDRDLEDWLAYEHEERGTKDAAFSAVGAVTGSVAFAKAFGAPPIVQVTVLVGSNLDILVNMQGVTTTGFTFRAFNKDGTAVTGTATLHWSAQAVDR